MQTASALPTRGLRQCGWFLSVVADDRARSNRRWCLAAWCVVAGVLGVGVLAWYFPARWALPWITPRLHGLQLQGVHGTVWHGRADGVLLPSGRELGRASWQVSRRAVYASTPLQLQVDGPQLAFSAQVRVLPDGRLAWRDVRLRADLAAWPLGAVGGVGHPLGEWQMRADHAVLQAGWPTQLDLRAQWHDAVLRTPAGAVSLGDLEWAVSASDGVVDARVRDAGNGPLQTTAQLLLSPLGWRLDAELHLRQPNPQLRRWLATLGPMDAADVVHVRRHGGVALPPPAAAPAASAPVAAQAATVGSGHGR